MLRYITLHTDIHAHTHTYLFPSRVSSILMCDAHFTQSPLIHVPPKLCRCFPHSTALAGNKPFKRGYWTATWKNGFNVLVKTCSTMDNPAASICIGSWWKGANLDVEIKKLRPQYHHFISFTHLQYILSTKLLSSPQSLQDVSIKYLLTCARHGEGQASLHRFISSSKSHLAYRTIPATAMESKPACECCDTNASKSYIGSVRLEVGSFVYQGLSHYLSWVSNIQVNHPMSNINMISNSDSHEANLAGTLLGKKKQLMILHQLCHMIHIISWLSHSFWDFRPKNCTWLRLWLYVFQFHRRHSSSEFCCCWEIFPPGFTSKKKSNNHWTSHKNQHSTQGKGKL